MPDRVGKADRAKDCIRLLIRLAPIHVAGKSADKKRRGGFSWVPEGGGLPPGRPPGKGDAAANPKVQRTFEGKGGRPENEQPHGHEAYSG